MISKYPIIEKADLLTFFLLITFPISLILGNAVINIYFLFFSISFFFNFKKNLNLINNKINYFLLFFFFSLLINLIFSIDLINSVPRVIKILLVFLFALEIQRFVIYNKLEKINLLFKIWSLIFFIIIIDVIFEFFIGHNLIGYSSYMPGRIASFFGDELVVGAFFHGFVLFFISHLVNEYPEKKLFLTITILILLYASFIIGERSNFLKTFFSLIIYSFLVLKINNTKKITAIFLMFLIIASIINFNKDYKYRYYGQITGIYEKNIWNYFIKNSQYGAHQLVAFEIFKDSPLFGVGIKNFMSQSYNSKYDNSNPNNNLRVGTHPHQLHMQFLSETGLFGYISFLIFIIGSVFLGIKEYLKSKNLYLISSIIFIISTLIPIIPSGSFFSTFSGSIFWINFIIMSAFILRKTKY